MPFSSSSLQFGILCRGCPEVIPHWLSLLPRALSSVSSSPGSHCSLSLFLWHYRDSSLPLPHRQKYFLFGSDQFSLSLHSRMLWGSRLGGGAHNLQGNQIKGAPQMRVPQGNCLETRGCFQTSATMGVKSLRVGVGAFLEKTCLRPFQ